jgi:hypothetical protein
MSRDFAYETFLNISSIYTKADNKFFSKGATDLLVKIHSIQISQSPHGSAGSFTSANNHRNW